MQPEGYLTGRPAKMARACRTQKAQLKELKEERQDCAPIEENLLLEEAEPISFEALTMGRPDFPECNTYGNMGKPLN
jgi:hypothetical protein